MADAVHIAVFENGALVAPPGGKGVREAVLALPLNRLLVKMVRVPAENAADPAAVATPVLKAASPFPDEPLAVSCETVRETEGGIVVLAAGLPEGAADDIAEALDAAGLNVTRVDATALGFLRSAWPKLGVSGEGERRLLLVGGADCISLFVLDGDCPSAIRALSNGCDMRREVMLSLIEAEDFGGAKPLKEVVVCGDVPVEGLDAFAPVRTIDPDGVDAVAGVAERTLEPDALNALPDSWREVLEETRFKRKMKTWLGAAAAIWLLAVGALVGVPKYYDYRAGQQEEIRKTHRASFRKVNEKKSQVESVRLISNHDQGALETLRVIASSKTPDVVLSKWNFKRGERLTFSGVAEGGTQQSVYDFKDAAASVMLSEVSENEDDADTPFFADVVLPRGVVSKNGKASFDMECVFKSKEEE